MRDQASTRVRLIDELTALRAEVAALRAAKAAADTPGIDEVDPTAGRAPVPHPEGNGEAAPSLGELVDLAQFQGPMDGFCQAMGIASAIIDLQGVTLVRSRCQRLCTDFHRTHETTRIRPAPVRTGPAAWTSP